MAAKKNLSVEEIVEKVIPAFQIQGEIREIGPCGNGHINETMKIISRSEDGTERQYVLQRINTDIFCQPEQLMENVANVTSFLRKKIIAGGGNPERETLNVVPASDGRNYAWDEYGNFWRMYLFITDAVCLEAVEKPEDFYASAYAFGDFQHQLADFPAETLHETIPNFHNTVSRFGNFVRAAEEDICGRAKDVAAEIDFVRAREADTAIICDALASGEIPLRVTHNDTKLNNVLFDGKTGEGLCVIDLDTVMPGSALYDFGDSIRFGASTAAEDEIDLSKVECDLALFEIYTKGYLEGCRGSLTEQEIRLFPEAAKIMTLECGMRFLTDHLQGDTYFRIHRPGHNLDRARTQFKLVRDMESKWDEMKEIVERILNA